MRAQLEVGCEQVVDGPVELLDGPRPFERPYLGPGPKLRLELIETEEDDANELMFRAVATIGMGEWPGERPEPVICWEVYGPDNRVSPSIFPEYGSERTLVLDDATAFTLQHPVPEHLRDRDTPDTRTEGTYAVRAATADVFGRPAVAYVTIAVARE